MQKRDLAQAAAPVQALVPVGGRAQVRVLRPELAGHAGLRPETALRPTGHAGIRPEAVIQREGYGRIQPEAAARMTGYAGLRPEAVMWRIGHAGIRPAEAVMQKEERADTRAAAELLQGAEESAGVQTGGSC